MQTGLFVPECYDDLGFAGYLEGNCRSYTGKGVHKDVLPPNLVCRSYCPYLECVKASLLLIIILVVSPVTTP